MTILTEFLQFSVIAEADMQKLSHALRILSEAEKQLRMSKNQTTWLTVALLQLTSKESSSLDTNDSKLCLRNPQDQGENHHNYCFLTINFVVHFCSFFFFWGGGGWGREH